MALTHQIVVRINQEQSDLLNHVIDVLDVKKSTMLRSLLVAQALSVLILRSQRQLSDVDSEPLAVVRNMLDSLPEHLRSPVEQAVMPPETEDSDDGDTDDGIDGDAAPGLDFGKSPLLEDAEIGPEFEALLTRDQMDAMADAFFFRSYEDDPEIEREDRLFDAAEAVLIALLRRDPRQYAAALTTLFTYSDEKLARLLTYLEDDE